jgi:hypothetical protein
VTVTPAMVIDAVTETRAALEPHVADDWTVAAGDLTWSCWKTGVHFARCLLWYAVQITGRDTEGTHLSFEIVLGDDAGPPELLRSIVVFGDILARTVAAAGPDDRAHHVYGVSDPEGFAAMGVLEVLVHTYDITRGLGVDWRPPDRLAAPLIARLFRHPPDGDPSAVLLWCTGRAALGDRPRQDRWRWDSTVP